MLFNDSNGRRIHCISLSHFFFTLFYTSVLREAELVAVLFAPVSRVNGHFGFGSSIGFRSVALGIDWALGVIQRTLEPTVLLLSYLKNGFLVLDAGSDSHLSVHVVHGYRCRKRIIQHFRYVVVPATINALNNLFL